MKKIQGLKTKIFIILFMVSSLILFEGCKVGPTFKTQRTEIDSTAVYRYDSIQLAMTDSVLNISWWE
ncbi:MAG: hypothetical protein WBN69_15915, partial [Eudoraea sp.]